MAAPTRAFRGAHQVLETGQVRKAPHGGEHALMGMGAVGKEAAEQQSFTGQPVEIRRDLRRADQHANRVHLTGCCPLIYGESHQVC